jgi:hypothetical protein
VTPVLAAVIEILPEGRGRFGWLTRSISISRTSFNAFQENMNAITENAWREVIAASTPVGKPLVAKIAPRKTPKMPVTEFPALKRSPHDANMLPRLTVAEVKRWT